MSTRASFFIVNTFKGLRDCYEPKLELTLRNAAPTQAAPGISIITTNSGFLKS
jgi:hypothetical protein